MSIFLDYMEPSIELNLYILQTFHALLVIAPYSMCTQLQAWDILCRCVIKYQTLLELYEREPKTKFIRWGLKGREEKSSNWPVAIINLFSTFPIRLAWTKRPDLLVRLLIQKKTRYKNEMFSCILKRIFPNLPRYWSIFISWENINFVWWICFAEKCIESST